MSKQPYMTARIPTRSIYEPVFVNIDEWRKTLVVMP